MAKEIEHKYLVTSDSWKKIASEGKVYVQGYMSSGGPTVRVRTVDEKRGFITFKSKVSRITRLEYEYEIPYEEAVEMLEFLTRGEIVRKLRYLCEVGGKTWEVDIFSGSNEGLMIAEIELEAEDEVFEIPSWVGECVSEDSRYSNSSLSQIPYTQWE